MPVLESIPPRVYAIDIAGLYLFVFCICLQCRSPRYAEGVHSVREHKEAVENFKPNSLSDFCDILGVEEILETPEALQCFLFLVSVARNCQCGLVWVRELPFSNLPFCFIEVAEGLVDLVNSHKIVAA